MHNQYVGLTKAFDDVRFVSSTLIGPDCISKRYSLVDGKLRVFLNNSMLSIDFAPYFII